MSAHLLWETHTKIVKRGNLRVLRICLKLKFYKNVLIGEILFLNSGFSLEFSAAFRSKNISGEAYMPSASIMPACLRLDCRQSVRSCCFHPGMMIAWTRAEDRMGARDVVARSVCPGARLPGFESVFYHLLEGWLGTNPLSPLCLCFLIVKWWRSYLPRGVAVSMHPWA